MECNEEFKKNKKVWSDFYSQDTKNCKFYDENIVRLFSSKEPDIPAPPAKILDHGFGSGNNIKFLLEKGYQVFGAEISKSAVEKLDKEFNENRKTVDLKEINGYEMPYEDNFFDIVLSWNALHYNATIENAQMVNQELYRVLKPGGVYILSTITTEHTLCIGAEELKKGHFAVKSNHRFDNRGGLKLFVPVSKEHFLEVYGWKFKNIRYGWINVNLFIPDKVLACHLMYGVK
ncbi:class I SAM-dependent methyltransferase [Candidatus Dependentiae bacterium]|nr:class I SAM-dependent methyltransferase [Candidatus Dependentiae bacterium]